MPENWGQPGRLSPKGRTSPDCGLLGSLMSEPGESNVRILDPEQSRQLLDVSLQVTDVSSSRELLVQLARRISEIVGVKVAFVGKRNGTWTVLAESQAEPALSSEGSAAGASESWARVVQIATS